jgi:hypothetical protein
MEKHSNGIGQGQCVAHAPPLCVSRAGDTHPEKQCLPGSFTLRAEWARQAGLRVKRSETGGRRVSRNRSKSRTHVASGLFCPNFCQNCPIISKPSTRADQKSQSAKCELSTRSSCALCVSIALPAVQYFLPFLPVLRAFSHPIPSTQSPTPRAAKAGSGWPGTR